jgi:biopolymer transport protein ExbB/TolQ
MASLTAHDIEKVIFHVAEALRVPVLILALLALAAVVVELGGFAMELIRRRTRNFSRLETAVGGASELLGKKDEQGALALLRPVAWSRAMERTMAALVIEASKDKTEDRLAKRLADFDFGSLRRLERTRLLVRAGPALGLMGTLIPLSPALAGLASGDVKRLSDNLRVAFSVTVLGLLVGAVAYGISLVRDRLYGQDLSDLEYVAATLGATTGPATATTSVVAPLKDDKRPTAAGDPLSEDKA